MTHRASSTETLIDAGEFKMLFFKELHLQVLRIFTQLASEMTVLFKWFKVVSLRNMVVALSQP